MASSSNLVMLIKNMKREFKCKYCDSFLEYINFKDDVIEYESLCCKKSYQHQFDEKLKKQFFNTYKFSNHNNYLLL